MRARLRRGSEGSTNDMQPKTCCNANTTKNRIAGENRNPGPVVQRTMHQKHTARAADKTMSLEYTLLAPADTRHCGGSDVLQLAPYELEELQPGNGQAR